MKHFLTITFAGLMTFLSFGQTSNLQAINCGATMISLNQNIYATGASGATAYTFKISGGGLVTPLTFTDPNNYTSLSNFALNYATTYNVEVAPTVGGTQLAYGTVCSITTPTPTSSLQSSNCGITYTTMIENLNATGSAGASAYTFQISGGGLVTPLTFTSSTNSTSLSNFALNFATTYSVDVAPTIGGTQYPYSTVCSITTPAPPTSTLELSSCGAVLDSMDQTIFANSSSGATAYTFRFSDGGLVSPLTFTASSNSVSLSNFTLNPNTTYTVDVAATVGGVQYPYGAICNVTTPISSKLQASDCGATMSSINQNIYATGSVGATAYTFRISGGGLASPLTFTSSNNGTSLSNFALNYATIYDVDVAATIGGTQYPYGDICNITTTTAPTTNLQAFNCGITYSSMSGTLFADGVNGATAYTFRLNGGGPGLIFTSSSNTASLSNFTLSFGTTYSVEVAPTIGGTLYPYGSSCNITTPSSFAAIAGNDKPAKTVQDKELNQNGFLFEAKMYPNPFGFATSLYLTSNDWDTPVAVSVYDATGRLIDSRLVDLNQQAQVQLGDNYNAGVYNVIITQNGNVKTSRIVKQ